MSKRKSEINRRRRQERQEAWRHAKFESQLKRGSQTRPASEAGLRTAKRP